MTRPLELPDDAPFSAEQRAWLNEFLACAQAGDDAQAGGTGGTAAATAVAPPSPNPAAPFTRKNPFPAPVLRNVMLTGPGSPKEIFHMELSLAGSGLEYEVGDALGVFPRNPEAAVDELLANLRFKPEEIVPTPDGGEAPLRQAMIENHDLRTLNKSLLTKWQQRSGSPFLRSLVEAADKQAIDDFAWGRELIDLVLDHPADFANAADFVSVLRKLQPRLYSIASSLKAHPDEVHLTVAAVRYEAHGRPRNGVCSCHLAAAAEGSKAHCFVHTNKAFRLPPDPATPIIMVGPGTGIAPFRAFLEDRRATGATGRNWLIFGNPYRATDYLYEEEFTAMHAAGLIHRLDLAWSRDQAHKIYVQDKLRDASREFWDWLEHGATFYVCGDAERMAKDVDAVLHDVAATHGGLGTDGAAAFVEQLRKDKRYLRDVY